MNLIRKGHRQSHRGVIGVESAIVMIAFVIVAAALAFVVLNMGFSTTQKAKTAIVSSLGEASSSMEIAGKVTGYGCTTSAGGCGTTTKLNVTSVPIKVVSGGDSVNLQNTTASIKYLSNSYQYDNIYVGPLTGNTYSSVSSAFTGANSELATTFTSTIHPISKAEPSTTKAIIYWTVRSNSNAILDQGEHAVIAIAHGANERPVALDKVRIEVVIPSGAPLTVERNIPNITTSVVDLG
ncbi:MAG: archaellin/type IV pilin N-terminal domain-containing protein [Candidatus Nitrosotenuis sp.]|jgi:flagellin FlaB